MLYSKIGLFFVLITLCACQNRTIDKLLPETLTFLQKQEQARCDCLDKYGANFMLQMETGITFMEGLPKQYDLQNISSEGVAAIKNDLSGFTNAMKMIMLCIHTKTQETYQSDQLTQMLIAEDFRVVLALDAAKTSSEKMRLMNQPSLEMMEELCPQHSKVVLKLQTFLEVAEILPKELQ